jgi:hypothetical protein
MTRFLILVLFAIGCGGDDGGGGGSGDAGVQGSCFYSCNTQLGTSYGCTSNAQLTSAAACSSNAESKCGGATDVGRSELVASCSLCSSTCKPSWYMP